MAYLFYSLPYVWPRVPVEIARIGIIVCGVVILGIILSYTPVWNKLFKPSTDNYDKIIKIKYTEPRSLLPVFQDIIWMLLLAILFSFGVLAIHNTIVDNMASETAIWRWILAILLFIVFPILGIINTLITLIPKRKSVRKKRHLEADRKKFVFKQDINTIYNKCIEALITMKSEIFEMDKNNTSNPIKAWRKNILFGDSVINITLNKTSTKEVEVHVLSDSQWINILGTIFRINKRNVSIFIKRLNSSIRETQQRKR